MDKNKYNYICFDVCVQSSADCMCPNCMLSSSAYRGSSYERGAMGMLLFMCKFFALCVGCIALYDCEQGKTF